MPFAPTTAPNWDRFAGTLVMLPQAGVRVTALPVPVMRPLASTVYGVIAVAELLYVPAVTPLALSVSVPLAIRLASPLAVTKVGMPNALATRNWPEVPAAVAPTAPVPLPYTRPFVGIVAAPVPPYATPSVPALILLAF